jgi:predicted  nucleic acid-binding Zn-ribbon protein
MVHCERCSSRFHSARALMIENCPRCLLRDDVTAPLVVESTEAMRADVERTRPDSEPAARPLDQEADVPSSDRP